jgi:hypothetical protein
MSQGIKFLLAGALIAVVSGCVARQALGRTRPDLAALISCDDGIFAFAETYTTSDVEPFRIGDSRTETVARLRHIQLLEHDQAQLRTSDARWRLAVPAKSGGWAVYTLWFKDERVTAVKAYYSVFAGL